MTILTGTKITLNDGTRHKACVHDKKQDCEDCSLKDKELKDCKNFARTDSN